LGSEIFATLGPAKMTKKFDIVVFGATGFTGKRVVRELASHPLSSTSTFAIAGRSLPKLKEINLSLDTTCEILVADVYDTKSIFEMVKSCRVVIDCVGPYRKWGEAVVSLCVDNGTHYVDINGEPEFVERMFEAYNDCAKEAGVTVVSCCGFDSVPAGMIVFTCIKDMGVAYAEAQLKEQGITPHSIEMVHKIKTGPTGMSINFATYDSLVESLAHVKDLREFRREHPRPAVKNIGPKQTFRKSVKWDERVASWVCLRLN
jgi:short subunit dehydrogenase-like uncharacterized protein